MKRSQVHRVSVTVVCAVFLAVLPQSVSAQSMARQFDSLFVIASSGEVKFQAMVQPAVDSIAALGPDVVPLLVKKMDTRSPRERLAIMQILKKIGPSAVPRLLPVLNSDNGLVVERACTGLGDIADTSATLALARISGHRRWQVREQSLDALGKIKDQRGLEAVMTGFRDSVGNVRKAAVVTAGRLVQESTIPALVGMFTDSFYGARLMAAEALLSMDTATVIAVLTDSVKSSAPEIGHVACLVLGKLATTEAQELLLLQTNSPDPQRRAHAAVALIAADPTDQCGYQGLLFPLETDRFVRLKVESAIAAVPPVTP